MKHNTWTAQNMTIICFGIYSGKHCACVWQREYKGVLQACPWGEGEEDQGGGADAEWGQSRPHRHDEPDEQGAETDAAPEVQREMGKCACSQRPDIRCFDGVKMVQTYHQPSSSNNVYNSFFFVQW